jgi:hypothetical protein
MKSAVIEEEKARRALNKAAGSVEGAAKLLRVPSYGLRVFVRTNPRLIDDALEREALLLDKAEAILFKALRGANARNRLRAAAFIVRSSIAKRRFIGL